MTIKQSLAGYVRQNLKHIEEKINNGFRHEYIIDELREIGFTVTLSGFRYALYLARIKRKKNLLEETIDKNDSENELSVTPKHYPKKIRI